MAILAISIYSLEWWEQNTSINRGKNLAIPWYGVDIVGALKGSLGPIFSAWLHDTNIDWKEVAAWSLAGAVVDSSGALIKAFFNYI